jgi:DNA polymerase-4
VRAEPSVLHLDLDAFFAAVEQRDRPSLRGKPLLVGGTGPRGVVATASYEARPYGCGSAMAMGEARRRCPRAAVVAPRFAAYRDTSRAVMHELGKLSRLVEPLSLDEAYVDLAVGHDGPRTVDTAAVSALATALRERIREVTGLTASVGAGTSKLVAKIASDLCKPDGLLVVPPGAERELLDPLPVSRLWSVGPAAARTLGTLGVKTVEQLRAVPPGELVAVLGTSAGGTLARLALGEDDRAVDAEREGKSIGSENTFPRDVVDRTWLLAELHGLVGGVARRLAASGLSARTVTVKVRQHDFETHTRSRTLAAGTDDPAVLRRVAGQLFAGVDVTEGLRLLGVSVSGLISWSQPELAIEEEPAPADVPAAPVADAPAMPRHPAFPPGADVVHDELGRGWVQGSGLGRVTLRLELPGDTRPGRVVTVPLDDPALHPAEPVVPPAVAAILAELAAGEAAPD